MTRGAHAGRSQRRRRRRAIPPVSRAGAPVEIARALKARAAPAFVRSISGGAAESATRVDRKAAATLRASKDRGQADALESLALGEVTAQAVSSACPIA